MNFAHAIATEFDRRKTANPRYSWRAFSRALGISHSTASRITRQSQRASDATIIAAGRRLGWPEPRITALIRAERVRRLQDAAVSRDFVADARWVASRANLTLDDVQLALHEALRTRRLAMTSADTWKVTN